MNIAFVYDRVNKWGGAERVLTELHRIWPKAPLYTAVYAPKTAPWAKDFTVIPSWLNRFPGLSTRHEYLPVLTPYAFESFDLSAYDVVLSVTSAEAKAVITKPNQLHLCYLLTPTRYLWSHADEYLKNGFKGRALGLFLDSLRRYDLVASSRPDRYMAISQAVAKRCQTYYHRQADTVIYPPVETTKFAAHPKHCLNVEPGYFLVVSRLVPYKKVDLVIRTCNQTGDRLVVVGTGSEAARLKRMAGKTITFLGSIDDEALACVYHHAKALVFPQEEEFGITAVEAQAAGIPVIAYKQGSAAELITSDTGLLCPEQTVAAFAKAFSVLKNHTWCDTTIQEHSRAFDSQVFRTRFKQYVEDAWHQFQHRG